MAGPAEAPLSYLGGKKKLSATELSFMKFIWKHPAGISSEEIYYHFPQARGTKGTILYNLSEKGYVEKNQRGRHHFYTALVTSEEYDQALLRQQINSVLGDTFFERLVAAFCGKKIIRWSAALLSLALLSTLTACGHKATSEKAESQSTEKTINIDTQQENRTDEELTISEPSVNPTEAANQKLIKDQTFEATLPPLGKVIFASYEPDIQSNALADVVFEIQRDGQTIERLEGMEQGNNRIDKRFNKVEAVSFSDYNSDGYSDIIIICNYLPASESAGTGGDSEARIYSGNKDGSFALERELTDDANFAVAEKTVISILGFMGVGQKEKAPAADGWQQAYIDYLQAQDTAQWQGYNLIYIDNDDIPELVEIGISEAAGCGIVSYADGKAQESQLSRLGFSYIEKENLLCNSDGNMDSYYDVVYRLENGRLVQIAAGYYGAADNSNVQFDESQNPIYQYEWNGVMMTQEEYGQALNGVYNTTRAKEGYTWGQWLSKEDVIQAIEAAGM